jgi:hypothetical protein
MSTSPDIRPPRRDDRSPGLATGARGRANRGRAYGVSALVAVTYYGRLNLGEDGSQRYRQSGLAAVDVGSGLMQYLQTTRPVHPSREHVDEHIDVHSYSHADDLCLICTRISVLSSSTGVVGCLPTKAQRSASIVIR